MSCHFVDSSAMQFRKTQITLYGGASFLQALWFLQYHCPYHNAVTELFLSFDAV